MQSASFREGTSEVAARGAQINPTLDRSWILKSTTAIRHQHQQRRCKQRPNQTIYEPEFREFEIMTSHYAQTPCRHAGNHDAYSALR